MFNLFSGSLKTIWRMKMLMTSKKKWLGIIVISLGITISPTYASGIPVVDGALNGKVDIEFSETKTHRKHETKQWENTNTNWRKHFTEISRGKLGNVYSLNIQNDKQLNKEDYLTFQKEAIKRCQKIGKDDTNTSRKLCLQMVEIDKQKIELYFTSLDQINYAQKALEQAIQAQQNGGNAGKVETAEQNVLIRFQDISRIIENYEYNMKILDAKKEFMREQREQIAKNDMDGAVPISNTIVKGVISTVLETQAAAYRTEAANLRDNNYKTSRNAFLEYSRPNKN